MKILPQTTMNNWLIYPGSFMQRLKEHGVLDAKIQVQSEEMTIPSDTECAKLNILPHQVAWIREVFIERGENTLMFARTVVPLETLTGEEKQLQHLKDRSLGSFLFKDPHLKRSPFEIFPLAVDSFIYQKIAEKIMLPHETLWSRTSVFETNHKKILLTEIFFPFVGSLT